MMKSILSLGLILSATQSYAIDSKELCGKKFYVSCEGQKNAKRDHFCSKKDPSKISDKKKASYCGKAAKKTARKSTKKSKVKKS